MIEEAERGIAAAKAVETDLTTPTEARDETDSRDGDKLIGTETATPSVNGT
jgi:hypothetical protein